MLKLMLPGCRTEADFRSKEVLAYLCPAVSPTHVFIAGPLSMQDTEKMLMACGGLGWERKIQLDLPTVQIYLGQKTASAKTRTVLSKLRCLVTWAKAMTYEELVKKLGYFPWNKTFGSFASVKFLKSHCRAKGVDVFSVALEVRIRATQREAAPV